MSTPIDIIVPVYGGVEETRRCLQSVLASRCRRPWRLIVIDDASPDPEMAPMLAALAREDDRITLLRNDTNLGFVATVNRGMALHPDCDLVLLNSDTEVANDWLDRLAAAAEGPRVATVTPFSNNATICSFPRFCRDNPLPANWSTQALDALFARCNAGQTLEIPTGVGFCLYIRRAALDQVGPFDAETFGRGYGEENDFCRRAAAKGWCNLLACDTFVYHAGGVSFSDEQQARIEKAQALLDRRYPDYHRLVHEHIQRDPAALARLKVLVELYRASPRPKVLHLTHHLSGGTLKHIRELAHHLRDRMDSLLLRPDHDGHTSLYFGVETDDPAIAFDLPADHPRLVRLLRALGVARLHYHHTLALETRLWGLPRDLELPYDITLHDYYFINAHPTQTDAQGRYQPDLERQQSVYPLAMPLAQWQRNQRQLLDDAQRIFAPSQAAADEMARHYPHLTYTVAFHPDSERLMPWPAVTPKALHAPPLRILVLGALSLEKGADLLEATAKAAQARGAGLEFHLLGYAYRPLDEAVHTHGAYDEEELAERIAAIDPHLIWFTALWPETYSYTLSEALVTGLPIAAPDLGAFPQRLQGRPLTWLLPWQITADEALARLTAIAEALAAAQGGPHSWPDQPHSPAGAHFYREHYLDGTPQVSPEPLEADALARDLAHSRALLAGSGRSRREALLKLLLRLRQSRLGRLLSRLVPVRLQRRIKRRLSRKPLHELES